MELAHLIAAAITLDKIPFLPATPQTTSHARSALVLTTRQEHALPTAESPSILDAAQAPATAARHPRIYPALPHALAPATITTTTHILPAGPKNRLKRITIYSTPLLPGVTVTRMMTTVISCNS